MATVARRPPSERRRSAPSRVIEDTGMDLLDDDDDEPEAPRGSASASGEVSEKKQRFVWTPDLHCRFEAAVHKLGVAHAKPQAIRRLMGCDGEENAPTRQNIKSHLQKYRLFFSKRLGRRGAKGGGGDDDDGEPSPLDPYLERQHNGLLAQLELHAKLHTQLLIQRSTQAALSLRMSHSQGRPALHPLQLQRLARHVLMQRNMLQHLVALLHSSTVEILAERGVPPGQIEAMAHQALSPLALGVGAQGGAPRGGAFGDASASGGAGGLGAQHTLYYPDQARFGPARPNAFCGAESPPNLTASAPPPAQQYDRFDVDPVPSTAEALPGEGLLTADFLPEVLPEEEDDAGCLE